MQIRKKDSKAIAHLSFNGTFAAESIDELNMIRNNEYMYTKAEIALKKQNTSRMNC